MEEKMIIQSKRSYIKTLLIVFIILIIFAVVGGGVMFLNFKGVMQVSITVYWISNVCCSIGIAGSVILLLFLLAIARMEINVTDKRVYGKAKFGKRVDLPLDSISAVATGMLKGIAVATSSGKINFLAISNNKEIHEAISKLLIERQTKEKRVATTTIKQEIPQSNADELKKYKDLLDSGVITQEEFDAKKKQLLGL